MQEKGKINLLDIRAPDPSKYALVLMDAIFTDDELTKCCYESSKRTTKPGLPADKVKLLEAMTHKFTYVQSLDCVKKKFGEKRFVDEWSVIKRKCIDKNNKANKNKL